MSKEAESRRRYIQGELSKLKPNGGTVKIQLTTALDHTHWLNITPEDLSEIEKILAPPAGDRDFTVIGFWGRADERHVVGVIEGSHNVQSGEDVYDHGLFAEVANVATADDAFTLFHGTSDDEETDQECRSCGEEYSGAGDGWDGECGDCADRNPENKEEDDDE